MGEGAALNLPVGHVLAGRYVVEALLGRGGMGQVYAARDQKLRRRVAIKTLRERGSGGQRLAREAETIAQLGHPGIVSIYDVLDEGGEVLLVMELVDGISLRKRLARGLLPAAEVAEIVAQTASALAAAHAQGLIHRDVKPDNIMVRPDGRVALLDFGVAKVMEKIDAHADTHVPVEALTDSGAVVGTPNYLAPEQARGEPVGPATDQFSLAVCAYELLVGSLPWPTDSMARMISAIVQDPPLPLRDRIREHGAELDALFARALAKRPQDRFPSVKELSEHLSAVLPKVGPITPQPRAPVTQSDSGARTDLTSAARAARRRVVLRRAALLGAPLAMIGMAVLAAVLLWPKSPPPPAPAPPRFRLAQLQPSRTGVPAAEAAYRRGLRHLGAGEASLATLALEEAIAADPEMASAHLQRLLYETYFCPTKQAIARPHFTAAKRNRETLTPRDQELLDALEPAVLDPPDLKEVAARLHALAARRPSDAQIWDAVGVAENKLFHFAASAEASRKAMETDPDDSLAGQLVLAQDQENTAEHDRIANECLKRVSGAEWCRTELSLGQAVHGNCVELERNARAMIALNPESLDGPRFLAYALAGQQASTEAIATALGERVALFPAAARPRAEKQNQIWMAMWSGDFAAALKLLESKELDPVWASVQTVEALWESGDRRGAGQAAQAYLRRAAALPRFERPESDPLPVMLARARAAELLSESDQEARREAWIQSWRTRLDDRAWPSASPVIWAIAYSYATNREQAVEAVAQLDRFGGLPQIANRRFWTHDGPAGDLLRLGGRTDDAIPRLRAETERCSFELERVRAQLGLGLALEEKHDAKGACASYAAVLSQWGTAKPRSVTAEAARARIKALGCH